MFLLAWVFCFVFVCLFKLAELLHGRGLMTAYVLLELPLDSNTDMELWTLRFWLIFLRDESDSKSNNVESVTYPPLQDGCLFDSIATTIQSSCLEKKSNVCNISVSNFKKLCKEIKDWQQFELDCP